MKKRFQNTVAQSGITLPVVVAISILVWLLSGVVEKGLWVQTGCMAISTYIFAELNNSNALLRVRSRMISATFLLLTCTTVYLFPSTAGWLSAVLFLTALTLLFSTYQDASSQGRYYYAFLCLGLISLLKVHILYFIPLLWLLCAIHLQSLNGRTWTASLLGLFTPYWLFFPWLIYSGQWQKVSDHFSVLGQFQFPIRYTVLSQPAHASVLFIILLIIIGQLHFWYKSYEDRIRIRQLYCFFAAIGWGASLFLLFQPQHYDLLTRIIIISGSPFVAHFFTLTSSKATNILFIVTLALSIVLITFNFVY